MLSLVQLRRAYTALVFPDVARATARVPRPLTSGLHNPDHRREAAHGSPRREGPRCSARCIDPFECRRAQPGESVDGHLIVKGTVPSADQQEQVAVLLRHCADQGVSVEAAVAVRAVAPTDSPTAAAARR